MHEICRGLTGVQHLEMRTVKTRLIAPRASNWRSSIVFKGQSTEDHIYVVAVR